MQMANFSLRKKIDGDNSSVTLRVIDPFSTNVFRIRAGDDKVVQLTERTAGARRCSSRSSTTTVGRRVSGRYSRISSRAVRGLLLLDEAGGRVAGWTGGQERHGTPTDRCAFAVTVYLSSCPAVHLVHFVASARLPTENASLCAFGASVAVCASPCSVFASAASASFRAWPDSFSASPNRAGRGDLVGRLAAVALELVEIRARQREARRPHDLRLALHVQVVEVHRLRRVELVLRDERARLQLEDVEAARDLGAHDHAVVPVRRPRAGVAPSAVRVERSAIEERDLLRVRRIGPIEHRDAALIPAPAP